MKVNNYLFYVTNVVGKDCIKEVSVSISNDTPINMNVNELFKKYGKYHITQWHIEDGVLNCCIFKNLKDIKIYNDISRRNA